MWPRCCWSPELYSLGVIPSELARVAKAREVADLGDQAERGQRRDAAERAQPLDLPRPALIVGDPLQLGVEGGELAIEAVEVDEHLLERELGEWIVQALARDPRLVLERPALDAVAVDPAVAQQLLADAVTGGGAGAAQIVAAAQQVTQSFGLGRGRADVAQQGAAVQRDELLGVAAVGLDAVAGADRDQRRGDDVARHTDRSQQPPQRESAGPGLVADREAGGSAEPLDEPADRLLGR